jgi:hypothetical protein
VIEKFIMTENGWLTTHDPAKALTGVRSFASARKYRLVAAALVSGLQKQFSSPLCHATLELAFEMADEPVSPERIAPIRSALQEYVRAYPRSLPDSTCSADRAAWALHQPSAEEAAHAAAWEATKALARLHPDAESSWRIVRKAAQRTVLALVRDVFGNPFRAVALDSTCRTSTVLALALQMYDTRDFTPMPILADALQDAGCEHVDILAHCRGGGPHSRGCWVVDLVL